jgi:hypothetical protein
MNLYFDVMGQGYAGINKQPADEMRELGITYSHSKGIPVGYCIIYYDCENVPEKLPSYIKEYT